MNQEVHIWAPATVANVAVGFDLLGFAIQGPGENIYLKKNIKSGVWITSNAKIPLESSKNTAGITAEYILNKYKISDGVSIRIEKQIPIGSGLGGSSTSAVGAALGLNELFNLGMNSHEIIDAALAGETFASGSRHADNVAPCVLGELTFVQSVDPVNVYTIPTPPDLHAVVALPKISIKTSEARALLKNHVEHQTVINQTRSLTGFILGCQKNDFKLIQKSLHDFWIEPQRAHLIPHFESLKKLCLDNKALGFSISGSGPAVFALTENLELAQKIKKALDDFTQIEWVGSWVSSLGNNGARIIK